MTTEQLIQEAKLPQKIRDLITELGFSNKLSLEEKVGLSQELESEIKLLASKVAEEEKERIFNFIEKNYGGSLAGYLRESEALAKDTL